MSFTFGEGAGPFPVVLADSDRLTLDHEAAVTVELDHLSGFVAGASLDVAVLGARRWLAYHLCTMQTVKYQQ